MTLGYIEAVYRLDAPLTPTECHVLATLASAANRKGILWMRQRVIADRTRLHVDTVKATLAALNKKGLIDKQRRYRDDQSESASMIILRFEPMALDSGKEGLSHPWGGSTTPKQELTNGAVDPAPSGVVDPPHEPSMELRTPKAPKGAVSVEAKTLAKSIWEAAPIESRRRSGLGDLEKATSAVLNRGGAPDQIQAAFGAYFGSEEATKDGRAHIKGVHRLLLQDRWKEWAPGASDSDEEGGSHVKRPPTPEELEKVWRFRLDGFTGNQHWDERKYGPLPGEAGCRVPAPLLGEYGFGA